MAEEIKQETIEKEVAKVETPKEDKKKEKEVKPELEREYVIPLRKKILKAPRYNRAKKAIKAIKEFLVRHMRVEGRDLRKVKIDKYLNEQVWFRGIKKPVTKIKVKVKKINGIVYAELAEVPKQVEFKMRKDKKFAEIAGKVSGKKQEVKKEESEEKKIEEKEKEKATAEAGLEKQKTEAKSKKHNVGGAHAKKTQPRRQSLKK